MKIPTLETILTDARFIGLTTATPVQRAKARLVEGRPLGELAEHPDVIEMLGGPDGVALSSKVDCPPAEVLDVSASRVGKTLFGVALCIWASQTVDVSGVSSGDILRYHVTALKVEGTRPFMQHLIAHVTSKPALRSLLVSEPTSTGCSLRHPSGRTIEVGGVPIDRAGGSALSVFSVGAFADEYPRMIGADDGVKNIEHFRDALLGRMLKGAQFYMTGSPWAPFGPCYDAVIENWGKPNRDLVVVRTNGRAANPSWWTPERCADLQRRNPTAYQTDVEAQFADRDSALLTAADLDAATRKDPMILAPELGAEDFAAIDPGARVNAFTLMIGRRVRYVDRVVVRMVLARQWVPRGRSLDLEFVFHSIAQICAPYRIRILHTDQFSIDSNAALARRYGLLLKETTISAANRFEIYDELRAAIAARRFEVNADPVVRSDLLSMRRRVTQNGVAIHLPTTGDGRHADYASAAALLFYAASGKRNRMAEVLRGISTAEMNRRLIAFQRGGNV